MPGTSKTKLSPYTSTSRSKEGTSRLYQRICSKPWLYFPQERELKLRMNMKYRVIKKLWFLTREFLKKIPPSCFSSLNIECVSNMLRMYRLCKNSTPFSIRILLKYSIISNPFLVIECLFILLEIVLKLSNIWKRKSNTKEIDDNSINNIS